MKYNRNIVPTKHAKNSVYDRADPDLGKCITDHIYSCISNNRSIMLIYVFLSMKIALNIIVITIYYLEYC